MSGFDTSTFDDLFIERLDAFTEKSLADIKAFSLRENIPYDQVGSMPLLLSLGIETNFCYSGPASRCGKAFSVSLR